MSEPSEIVGYIGGGAGVAAGLSWLVKVLGARVVQKEDAEKETLRRELAEAKKAERQISESLIELKADLRGLKTSVDTFGTQVARMATDHERDLGDMRREFREMVETSEARLKADMQRLIPLPPPPPSSRRR